MYASMQLVVDSMWAAHLFKNGAEFLGQDIHQPLLLNLLYYITKQERQKHQWLVAK